MKKIIILLGAPGSGKGTQAVFIKEKLRVPHISTGDLLREHMHKATKLGELAKDYINQGKLVPDNLIIDMVTERIHQQDCYDGAILDGFPRTTLQAESLQKCLENEDAAICAINIAVETSSIVERITGRRICKACGAPCHIKFSPPKKPGVCDLCGGELYQRSDDTEKVIKKRLEVYNSQTKPLIDWYASKNALHEVDGSGHPEKVCKEILQIIEQNVYR